MIRASFVEMKVEQPFPPSEERVDDKCGGWSQVTILRGGEGGHKTCPPDN